MQRNATIARYLNPRKFKREQAQLQRIAELRSRDGDHCRRCRRPMRFDLPSGHDLAPKIHDVAPDRIGDTTPTLEALCLCHTRCNAAGADHTPLVTERARRKNEAELFARSRSSAA
jgi:hypothetical protein